MAVAAAGDDLPGQRGAVGRRAPAQPRLLAGGERRDRCSGPAASRSGAAASPEPRVGLARGAEAFAGVEGGPRAGQARVRHRRAGDVDEAAVARDVGVQAAVEGLDPVEDLVEAQVRDAVGADVARDEHEVREVGLGQPEDVAVLADVVQRDRPRVAATRDRSAGRSAGRRRRRRRSPDRCGRPASGPRSRSSWPARRARRGATAAGSPARRSTFGRPRRPRRGARRPRLGAAASPRAAIVSSGVTSFPALNLWRQPPRIIVRATT